jgi:hypothetical protein
VRGRERGDRGARDGELRVGDDVAGEEPGREAAIELVTGVERVCVDVIIRHPARLALPASGFNFAFAHFEPFSFAFAPAFALSSTIRGARTAP